MKVQLTGIEIWQAAMVGIARRIDSKKKHLSNKAPTDSQWQVDIEGALAEMALGKALGIYAGLTIGNYGGTDVGQYHVRYSPLSHACLIIRPDDLIEGCYVLVTGLEGDYLVHGYIHGANARQKEWWKAPNDRPGAWFVPQAALTKFI